MKIVDAAEVPRRRTHATLHDDLYDPIQRVVIALAPDTLALEVKPGPYRPLDDKDFAAWAPAEGDAGMEGMLRWFERAEEGAMPPRA